MEAARQDTKTTVLLIRAAFDAQVLINAAVPNWRGPRRVPRHFATSHYQSWFYEATYGSPESSVPVATLDLHLVGTSCFTSSSQLSTTRISRSPLDGSAV